MKSPTESLMKYVVDHVEPEDFYTDVFPDIRWTSGDEARVLSPFVVEKEPSLSINRVTGAWYSFCKSNKQGGQNLVTFYAALHDKSHLLSARELFDQYIHPVIPEKVIRQWNRVLLETPSILKYIVQKRRVSMQVIKSLRLGWDGLRIMFPVYNEYGICVNAKRYDPTHTAGSKLPKMLHYVSKDDERSFGSPPMIYPLSVLQEKSYENVVVCEGEWDTAALLSLGIPAVTSTGGAKVWPRYYNYAFMGKNVVVCYDNDETGVEERKRPCQNLSGMVKSLRIFDVPKEDGKDISDLLIKKDIKSKDEVLKLLESTPVVAKNENVEIKDAQKVLEGVLLDKASRAEYLGKLISVSALVTGKNYAPFIVPIRYRIICNKDCENCRVANSQLGFVEQSLNPSDLKILSLVEIPNGTLRHILLGAAGIEKSSCQAEIEYVESVNIEKLQIIPVIDIDSSGEYSRQSAYYIGHGTKPNRAYKFTGKLCPNPKTQIATYLFDKAVPVQDEIETFVMTPKIKRGLSIFRVPKGSTAEKQIRRIALWQSTHITKIYERVDLHIAVDLAYHSALSFDFNREYIHKGSLDLLVIGDTRTGKGFVTERLRRYYQAGDIASGENCTQRGLIGACQKIDGEWMINWGMFPLNHRRLVVIDELSSLQPQQISELTRVRSEGVAEIVKVIRESTQANLRIISLSNPRSGRAMRSYNTGPEAVKELIGANEDISRFDFVLSCASEEVASNIINTVRGTDDADLSKFPQKNCRDLIFWIWSRKPNQIQFTKEATQQIINSSIRFGKMYSATIPLVQAENIRFKLAKIAVAAAGRVFSSDEEGENLIVTEEHAKFAAHFLTQIYSKPSFDYHRYSEMSVASSELGDKEKITRILQTLGSNEDVTIRGLLELQRITIENLGDFAGDVGVSRMIISELVQEKCLTRIEAAKMYLKNPQFTIFLRDYQCQKIKNQNT